MPKLTRPYEVIRLTEVDAAQGHTLTEREITILRVALIRRLDYLKRDVDEGTGLNIEVDVGLYEETKALLAKLWDWRKGLKNVG